MSPSFVKHLNGDEIIITTMRFFCICFTMLFKIDPVKQL